MVFAFLDITTRGKARVASLEEGIVIMRTYTVIWSGKIICFIKWH